MAKRAMLVGVNRELKTFPDSVQKSATAVLAQELAREYDAGRLASAGQLMRALDQLRRLAAPPKPTSSKVPAAPEDVEVVTDELDELARARADRLADAAGVVRSIVGDERRRGGRTAR